MWASNMENDMEVLILSRQEQIRFPNNTCIISEVKHMGIFIRALTLCPNNADTGISSD